MEELYLLLKKTKTQLNPKLMWFDIMRRPYIRKYIIQELIQKDQLQGKGIDEDGDIIGRYSEFTEMINPKKVAGEPYTLKDTGEFYESMYIRIGLDYIEIDADPIKTNDKGEQTNLFYEYGEGIIGLTEQSKNKLAEKLKIEYANYIRELLYQTK